MPDIYQRCSYVARRMGEPGDRFVSATDSVERDKARKWVEAWRFFNGMRKSAQQLANAT